MEIFGIGPLELLYILLIALIVLGPKDMVKAGRTLGKFLRKIVMSSSWRTVQQASQEFRHLPNKLIREAGLEEFEQDVKEINKISKSYLDDIKRNEKDFQEFQDDISTWTTPQISELSSDSPSINPTKSSPDAPPNGEPSPDKQPTSNDVDEDSKQNIDSGRE
jgi:sec-independent protein translocase protein TatB